jgi:hypothetical protein
VTRIGAAVQRQAARDRVLQDLRRQASFWQRIMRLHRPDSEVQAFRKEVARLWRLALRAVEQAP